MQAEEHNHIGPEVFTALEAGRCALASLIGTEPAVGFLASKRRLDPDFGFSYHSLVTKDVAAVAESLEPVGRLFPAVQPFAIRIKPRIFFFLEEIADFGQMSVEPIGLQFELSAHPAVRFNCTDRQFYKRAWQ